MEITKLVAADRVRTFVKHRNSLQDDRAWKAMPQSSLSSTRGDTVATVWMLSVSPRFQVSCCACTGDFLMTSARRMTNVALHLVPQKPNLVVINDGPCTSLLNG